MTARESELYLDRKHLATQAYGDSGNLQARSDIYSYQQPLVDLQGWVIDHVTWRGDERVLDVGCGPGSYLKRLAERPGLRLSGFDLSRGMLVDLAQSWTPDMLPPGRAVADIQTLPLLDATQDVVLATHMLYHVPDIACAAHELRRVLRPGGLLLAVTNAAEHTRELFELYGSALQNLGVDDTIVAQSKYSPSSLRFARENGAALLRSAFEDIVRHDKNSQLIVRDPEPVLRYLTSTRASREPTLPDGITWNDVMIEAERIVNNTILEQGMFRVRTAVSLFVCR